jgi:inorganic pyrophosphatase/exopolyphosphatase
VSSRTARATQTNPVSKKTRTYRWKNVYIKPTSNRELISKIYKEFNFNHPKTKEPNQNMGYRTKLRIHKEESPMAEKRLKKCSKSLVIREMQIKTTLRFHLTQFRMARIKTSVDNIC